MDQKLFSLFLEVEKLENIKRRDWVEMRRIGCALVQVTRGYFERRRNQNGGSLWYLGNLHLVFGIERALKRSMPQIKRKKRKAKNIEVVKGNLICLNKHVHKCFLIF